ncbi:ankyrin repeat-containing domain protein [Gorgonomyces haynaldii]|nr:ankyrin repeat-containing domain protein [Gorgonomyces haynaldii]
MSLTELPNELLKNVTVYLSARDYMRLHKTSQCMYRKREPYMFSIPESELMRLLTLAPNQVFDYAVVEWTHECIPVAFAKGLTVCKKLIQDKRLKRDSYLLELEWLPEWVGRHQSQPVYSGTLLHISCMFGHSDLTRQLLNAGFDSQSLDMYRLKTPLCYAICRKDIQMCQLLIERLPKGVLYAEREELAIITAASHGNLAILHLLLDNGQDINHVDDYGYNALDSACHFGPFETVQWLFQNHPQLLTGDRIRFLISSTMNPDIRVFDIVLKHFINDTTEHWKERVLEQAVHRGRVDICSKVLDLGASVDGLPDERQTPLYLAIKSRNRPLFDLLMQHNPKLYVGNPDKDCPVSLPLSVESLEMIRILIERHPDIVPWACRDGVKGPLHLFHAEASLLRFQMLIENGANVNVQTKQGRTPLMLAIQHGNLEVAEYLLACGANIHLKDHEGRTAIMHAVKHRKADFVRLLFSKGATLPKKMPDRKSEHEQELSDWLTRVLAGLTEE